MSDGRRADVVVVGGGIAGLSAAWELRDVDVRLLEAGDRLGGRLRSEPRGPYWLNFGGHVLGGEGTATDRLLRGAGVEAVEVPGILSALALNGRLVAGGRVETYPLRVPLAPRDRLALVRAGARVRLAVAEYGRVARRRPGESEGERRARVLAYRDDATFARFLGPVPPDVDAMFRATIRRSAGEPEEVTAGYGIGYFQLVWDRARGLTRNVLGGSGLLPAAIGRALGPRALTGAEVRRVTQGADGVVVDYVHDGRSETLRARAAVVATPAYVARTIVADLPPDVAAALDGIAYGPYVVGAVLTDETEPMPYDGIYAAATPKASFNMVFNTANALRRPGARRPGGSLMVYAAAGAARELAPLDDGAVEARFVADLLALFPPLRGHVREVAVQRWERGLPHPRPGRHLLQPALERPLGAVHLAGDYLGTTYVETAVETGATAARAARAALGSAKMPSDDREGGA